MKKILLITGPGGDAQGWGDLRVTECVRDALIARFPVSHRLGGRRLPILERAFADKIPCEIIWSALYYITLRADIIGPQRRRQRGGGSVGCARHSYRPRNAQAMKTLIDKAATHRILQEHGACVSQSGWLAAPARPAGSRLPGFVKPFAPNPARWASATRA